MRRSLDPPAEPLLGRVPPISLKETCRIAEGRVPLWPYHRARLAAGGCGEAMLAEADRLVGRCAAEWAVAPTRRARLTLVATADGIVTAEVARRLSSLDVPNGLVVARVDVDELPPLPPGPAKPADRTRWDAAHREADALGAHQAVLVAPDGTIVDGSTATVWIAENGALVTPPAPPAIPGVARAFVIAEAAGVRAPVRVEPVSWERFEAADEAFLTNAFGGAVEVRGRGGEIFSAVAGLFTALWGGNRR